MGKVVFEGTYVHTNLELTGPYRISEENSYVIVENSTTGATVAEASIEPEFEEEVSSVVVLKVN
ncbi:hypothetical protein, partial [Salmonella sp. s51228]|uniref:hypothetical protein n=1 Tax=Salmonella sp. s51228 TaxID=3159652 RepID=UPI003981743B